MQFQQPEICPPGSGGAGTAHGDMATNAAMVVAKPARRQPAEIAAELAGLLRIRGEPVYCNIAHWPRTMPQYHVGHLGLVARIEARAAMLSGLALAGNAFRGVGIPHCIHSGEAAAERIVGSGK